MNCAQCGKEFHVGPAGWGYAYGGLYTCSYKCMREMEKENERKMSEGKQARKILTDEERAKIDELAAQGFTNAAIAEAMEISRSVVGGYLGGKNRGAAQTAVREQVAESVTMPQILSNIGGKEVPECDELTRMVVRLMADMVAILKRIV